MKNLSLLYCKSYSQSLANLCWSWENWKWKHQFSSSSSSSFLSSLLSCFWSSITWKLYRMYMNFLHFKLLLYYWRSSFSGLELCAGYGPKHASWLLFDTPFCVYSTSSVTQKTQGVYNSTLHQVAFLLPMILLWASYNLWTAVQNI